MTRKKSIVKVILLLLATPCFALPDKRIPPRVEQIARYGCKLDLVTPSRAIRGGWYVIVWADYKDMKEAASPAHHWSALYAIEEKREKAFDACDEWMESVEKAVKNGVEAKHE